MTSHPAPAPEQQSGVRGTVNKLFRHKEYTLDPTTFDPTEPYSCIKCGRSLTLRQAYCPACGQKRPACQYDATCKRLPFPGIMTCAFHHEGPVPNSTMCQLCHGKGVIARRKVLGMHNPLKPHEVKCTNCWGSGRFPTLPKELWYTGFKTTVISETVTTIATHEGIAPPPTTSEGITTSTTGWKPVSEGATAAGYPAGPGSFQAPLGVPAAAPAAREAARPGSMYGEDQPVYAAQPLQ